MLLKRRPLEFALLQTTCNITEQQRMADLWTATRIGQVGDKSHGFSEENGASRQKITKNRYIAGVDLLHRVYSAYRIYLERRDISSIIYRTLFHPTQAPPRLNNEELRWLCLGSEVLFHITYRTPSYWLSTAMPAPCGRYRQTDKRCLRSSRLLQCTDVQ